MSGDAIYDGGAALALGPGNAVNVFVVESEMGLLGAVKGELDLDSPALLIGFDVQYDSDNVAYMDLSAGRKGDHDDFRDYASGTDLYPNGYGFESDDFMASSRLVVRDRPSGGEGTRVELGARRVVKKKIGEKFFQGIKGFL